MPRALLVAGLALAAVAAPADAADERDVAARRAAPGFAQRDPVARCAVGRAYLGHDDARALLYLASCGAEAAADRERATARQRGLGAARVEVLATAPGVWVTLDGQPPDELLAPATLWLAPGVHRFVATIGGQAMANTIVLEPDTSATVLFEVPSTPAPPPGTAEIDFGEQAEPQEAGIAGPPPKLEHASLLPDRYRRGLAAEGRADAAAPPRRGTRAVLGVGLGVAVSDSPATGVTAAAPLVLAVEAGVVGGRGWGLHLRAEGTRRGGAPAAGDPPGVFTLSLAALARRELIAARWLGVDAMAGLRGVAAFEDRLGGAPVRRGSLDALAGVTAAVTPWRVVAVTLLLDHGLTPLVDGARARGLTTTLSLQRTFP